MTARAKHPGSPPRFDPEGDLPWGHLAIEASAGTGKTYTLCQLVVRYIAEAGVAPSSFLIVTFTRAATAELRGRIRQAIAERIASLRAGTVDLPPRESTAQLRNLERALTEYDTITVTTIHSFATQTLGSLGSMSRFDPPRSFADDDEDTIRSACTDAVVRIVGNGTDPSLVPDIGTLVQDLMTARSKPDITIEPAEPDGEPTPRTVQAAIVRDALVMLRLRRSLRGRSSFDDVLTSLRDTIGADEAGLAVESLRNRYRIVMIDEFQDTDPIQWAILGALFQPHPTGQVALASGPERALITVGDPKQSIYSFRGADITTYSLATGAETAQRVALGTNWRSDGRLLAGLEFLLADTTYGRDIGFTPVGAAPGNEQRFALDGDDPIVPIRLRLALGDDIERTSRGIGAAAARDAVWSDLVGQVHHTLDHVRIPDGNGGYRSTRPDDIAVLVRTGQQADEAQSLLIASGVPAVLSRAGRVLDSPAAEQWQWLLDALLRPSDPKRARRFALSWFGGIDARGLDSMDDTSMTALFQLLRSWLETLREAGVAEFVRTVLTESGVIPRLLRNVDGDRSVTDLLHVGEILQTNSVDAHPSIATLLDLLQPRTSPSGSDDADEFARRVETQDPSVQIMTVWVSKGLEFPIVMLPTMYSMHGHKPPVIYSDADGNRFFDVSGDDAPEERRRAARARQIEEDLRLAYVALTRASHQVTVWWATPNYSPKAAISRILFARDETGAIDPAVYVQDEVAVPKDQSGAQPLVELACGSDGLVDATIIGEAGSTQRHWIPGQETPTVHGPATELSAAILERIPPRQTGRWSFTAMTSGEERHANPDDTTMGDGGAADEHQPAERLPDGSVHHMERRETHETETIPLGWLPAGAGFGTLVHSLYEQLDFTVADPDQVVAELLAEELSWRDLDLTPPLLDGSTHDDGARLLVQGLSRTLETPLGPLFDDRPLRSITPGDRLNELSFEMLLTHGSGGLLRPADKRPPVPTDGDIGRLVSDWTSGNDPLGSWARELAVGRFGVPLAGHLTGSIDAVLRVERDGVNRYVIADYKTNRLAGPDDMPLPEQYLRTPMTQAMVHHHYPLQALLYSVALHRYLRGRIPDYRPEVHLGGVAYLFVRGMVGPDAPTVDGCRSGVWCWEPPAGLVSDLSNLLAGSYDIDGASAVDGASQVDGASVGVDP